MTHDVVAPCERPPDAGSTLAAMHACGPDLRVTTPERGCAVQLCTEEGTPLVTIEGARAAGRRPLLGVTEALPTTSSPRDAVDRALLTASSPRDAGVGTGAPVVARRGVDHAR